MNKKFLFLSMILAAGLVFAGCKGEEEQTEETPAEDTTVVVEQAPVDTPVIEEAAAPAVKKAPAKKTQVKEEPKAQPVTNESNTGVKVNQTAAQSELNSSTQKRTQKEIQEANNKNAQQSATKTLGTNNNVKTIPIKK